MVEFINSIFYHSAQKSLVRAFSRSKRVSGEPRENTIFLYVLDEVQTPAFMGNSITCQLCFLGKISYISCTVLKYQLDEVDVYHSIHPGLSTTCLLNVGSASDEAHEQMFQSCEKV